MKRISIVFAIQRHSCCKYMSIKLNLLNYDKNVILYISTGQIKATKMANKPILYYTPLSQPCRSVLLAAATIGVDLELKPINLVAGEHLTPEFLKVISKFVFVYFFF